MLVHQMTLMLNRMINCMFQIEMLNKTLLLKLCKKVNIINSVQCHLKSIKVDKTLYIMKYKTDFKMINSLKNNMKIQ